MNSLQTSVSIFNDRHSLIIRLWHWTLFLLITASLITVLLASTLFDTSANIPVVTEQMLRKGSVVSPEQAKAVAHEFNNKFWNLHKWIGYAICFLLLSRIIIEVGHSKEERLGSKIKKSLNFLVKNDTQKADRRHYLFAKFGYLVFYLLILIMAMTGLGLAYDDIPFLKSIHKPLISLHNFTQYLIYLYILLHLVGVIRADVTSAPGIVSGMINGNKS